MACSHRVNYSTAALVSAKGLPGNTNARRGGGVIPLPKEKLRLLNIPPGIEILLILQHIMQIIKNNNIEQL